MATRKQRGVRVVCICGLPLVCWSWLLPSRWSVVRAICCHSLTRRGRTQQRLHLTYSEQPLQLHQHGMERHDITTSTLHLIRPASLRGLALSSTLPPQPLSLLRLRDRLLLSSHSES